MSRKARRRERHGSGQVASGTRFFVKRLKRGTQYTFGVRGRNSEGAGDASHPVTQNTPIASLHNALFFKQCVNYFDDGARVSEYGDPTHLVRAAADHDYKTFTTEKDLVINIAVGGNPTRIDAIFVKGIDIEGHSAEPTGGTGSGYSNRMMPSTVKNWEGSDVSTVGCRFPARLVSVALALHGDECAADVHWGECQDSRNNAFGVRN